MSTSIFDVINKTKDYFLGDMPIISMEKGRIFYADTNRSCHREHRNTNGLNGDRQRGVKRWRYTDNEDRDNRREMYWRQGLAIRI